MQRLFLTFLMGLMALPFPAIVLAATDVYGDAVIAASTIDLLTPENAAGAPDNRYADFRDSMTYLTIDMGEGEEGFGDLLASIRIISLGATGRATLYDSAWNVLQTESFTFPAYSTTWTVDYAGSTAYRYVKIESPETEQWGLDAVQATQVMTPPEEPPTPPGSEEIPYCTENCGRAGMLVKGPDTSAVYFIDRAGTRHVFPNDTVFFSWGYSFSNVLEISRDELASYPLGKNVTMRPGTWLMKITWDPKVYAVEPGGVLRWVKTEAVAEAVYGETWNERIVDVSEVFWKNYTVGFELSSETELPVGTVFAQEGAHYLTEADGFRELNVAEETGLRIDADFILTTDPNVITRVPMETPADNEDLVDFVHPF